MDKAEKRLDITVEAVKQQLTLASAIIAATTALAEHNSRLFQAMRWSLIPLGISVGAGALSMLTIPYALYYRADPFKGIVVRASGATQAISFALGLILMVAFAVCS